MAKIEMNYRVMNYRDKWFPQNPDVHPWVQPLNPVPVWPVTVSRSEFDELKKQVEEMLSLLRRAKQYDEDNNEPNCEMEDKMALLRAVAKAVGVDLDAALNK